MVEDAPALEVSVLHEWKTRRVPTGAQKPPSATSRHAAAYLRELTARHRWKTADLARASGVPYEATRRYLRGERQMTMDDFHDLCVALGTETSVVWNEARRRARQEDAGTG